MPDRHVNGLIILIMASNTLASKIFYITGDSKNKKKAHFTNATPKQSLTAIHKTHKHSASYQKSLIIGLQCPKRNATLSDTQRELDSLLLNNNNK